MTPAKTLTRLALLPLFGLTLAACSGGSSGSDEATEDIDLRMTIWTSNEDHLALFNSIADSYMEDHPEIASITFDPLPFDDYTSTVTTQLAGGSPPDMAWILENAAPDFVASGALMPLSDTFEATEGYDVEDISESAAALWNEDGELIAYPFSTSPFVTFVNNDLLAEAGLPSGAEMLDDGRWDWDSVSDAGATVAQETGESGFVIRDFDYLNWDYLSTVWNGWGAEPWSEDGTQCTFDSPEMVQAFEFLHDAAFDAGSMPGPGSSADFFAGESAFTVTQISRANLLPEDGFDWDLLPLPEGPDGEYAVTGQAGVGVLQGGPNPQASAEFLAYFTNAENGADLAEFFPPPRESLLTEDVLSDANPLLTPDQIEDVVIPGITEGVVRPSHTDAVQIAQQARASLDDLWTEDADVPAVLEQTCGAISPLLGSDT